MFRENDSENESKHVAQILTSHDNCIIVKYIVALDCTFLLFYDLSFYFTWFYNYVTKAMEIWKYLLGLQS
jgi:hypothetical protein